MRNDRFERATSASAEVLEGERVVGRRAEVEDRDATARAQDARDLPDRALAPGRIGDVVDRERRDDRVEARVGERQRAHVAVDDLDALGDALGLGVRERRGAAVVGLVDLRPEVDADRPAGGHALRRADQQEPAAAADVEDLLVAAQAEAGEQAVALDELAAPARVQHRRGRGEEHRAGQPERAGEPGHPEDREREPPEQERRARDREVADERGRVEPVVDLHTAMSARAVSGPSPRWRRECVRPYRK